MSASGPSAPTGHCGRDVLVGICDFPSAYDFPPHGYGGIERWLWAVAVGAKRAGSDVHLLGPKWRTDLDGFTRRPIRLEDLTDATALKATGYDLLVVGHEYPSLPAWRRIFDQLDADFASFQHWPYFQHIPDAFDGCRRRLYCYSPEMCQRYGAHMPFSELAVHLGFQEEEPPATDGADLVWLGRIDEQKAPHIAVLAARLLGRRIRLVGPVFDRMYLDRHQRLLQAPHVKLVGELRGPAKVAALHGVSALVYTCGREYIEAGAAVFGEALRAGTPVAALTWRPGTCADAALCAETGRVATVGPDLSDGQAAEALAAAIEATEDLKATMVQEIGMARFDPLRHFQALASRS
jgi:glycosyltransferase involved in cell wall biosynthesis